MLRDVVVQRAIAARIDNVDPGAEHGGGQPICLKRGSMRNRVYSKRHPADYACSGRCQRRCEFARHARSVRRMLPASNYRDAGARKNCDIAGIVKFLRGRHDRREVDGPFSSVRAHDLICRHRTQGSGAVWAAGLAASSLRRNSSVHHAASSVVSPSRLAALIEKIPNASGASIGGT